MWDTGLAILRSLSLYPASPARFFDRQNIPTPRVEGRDFETPAYREGVT